MSRNAVADALIEFLNASPTPFHAVETAVARLRAAGAVALDEKQSTWNLAPGQMAYVIRNGSSLIALRIPADFAVEPTGNPGTALTDTGASNPESQSPQRQTHATRFRIAAAHTDSPCLKLKPRAPEPAANYRQWGVEVYGGVLFNSWLDRDLGLAGRITRMGPQGPVSTLARLDNRPLRIPQLAIHLDRGVNDAGLILNAQRHLVPITGLTDPAGHSIEDWIEEVGGAPLAELTFDLHLFDRSLACYGGYGDEFIYSGRLDNLGMSHAVLESFLAATGEMKGPIQVAALFDNEEVGSVSAQGAESNFIGATLERALAALGASRSENFAALARSHMVSADMAHALHPNYMEKHEPNHFPLLNHGPVIKSNASQRYATNAETAALFRDCCRRAETPVQDFITRTDLACGTTIGPHVAAALGIPTVDVGNPMLSMHSAREMCGSEDQAMMIAALEQFFVG